MIKPWVVESTLPTSFLFHVCCPTCPTCPLVLPVCFDELNRVRLVCVGDTHDCGDDDIEGCCVRGCAEICGGGDVCGGGGIVVDRAVVTTLAGKVSGTNAGFADGSGTNARFFSPTGVAVDASGNVFVGDQQNQRIRKVTAGGGTYRSSHSARSFRQSCRSAHGSLHLFSHFVSSVSRVHLFYLSALMC